MVGLERKRARSLEIGLVNGEKCTGEREIRCFSCVKTAGYIDVMGNYAGSAVKIILEVDGEEVSERMSISMY